MQCMYVCNVCMYNYKCIHIHIYIYIHVVYVMMDEKLLYHIKRDEHPFASYFGVHQGTGVWPHARIYTLRDVLIAHAARSKSSG